MVTCSSSSPVHEVEDARGTSAIMKDKFPRGHQPDRVCPQRSQCRAQRCARGLAHRDKAACRVLLRGFLKFSELGLSTCRTGIIFYMF